MLWSNHYRFRTPIVEGFHAVGTSSTISNVYVLLTTTIDLDTASMKCSRRRATASRNHTELQSALVENIHGIHKQTHTHTVIGGALVVSKGSLVLIICSFAGSLNRIINCPYELDGIFLKVESIPERWTASPCLPNSATMNQMSFFVARHSSRDECVCVLV